jgi:hypothetical protein
MCSFTTNTGRPNFPLRPARRSAANKRDLPERVNAGASPARSCGHNTGEGAKCGHIHHVQEVHP